MASTLHDHEKIRITSRRLVLKRMTVEDITESYVTWLNDFETTKYLEVRFTPQTRKDVEEYVRKGLPAASHRLHFGVFDEEGKRLVGTVTFNGVDHHHRSASISFVIGHPEAQGKGYGTEAVHAATHYLFSQMKFVKIWGGYYAGHVASEKVFFKNGYKVEGVLKKKLVAYDGSRVDHIYVGILREEFVPDERYLGRIS